MKQRFTLFRRGTTFYCQDTESGQQTSLRTKDKGEANVLLHSKNEAFRQPVLNLQIARTYLSATDPVFELELELALVADPEAGALIPGAKGLRKIRRPLAGRGKRGGARVIYYYIVSAQQILLLYAYAKNRQGDLTPAQAKQLVQLVLEEFP